jgi:hypothetical protein
VGDGRLPDQVARASDFLLVHFNNTPLQDIPRRLSELRSYGKPIVCNEDQKVGRAGAQAAQLCLTNGASWGLMLEKINQQFPFSFQGAADDAAVYETLRQLAVRPPSRGPR